MKTRFKAIRKFAELLRGTEYVVWYGDMYDLSPEAEKVLELLSSPEKKEEEWKCEKCGKKVEQGELLSGRCLDCANKFFDLKKVEKEEPTQELEITFERNQYTGDRWVEIENGAGGIDLIDGVLRLSEDNLIKMLKLLQDKKLKSKIERLLK